MIKINENSRKVYFGPILYLIIYFKASKIFLKNPLLSPFPISIFFYHQIISEKIMNRSLEKLVTTERTEGRTSLNSQELLCHGSKKSTRKTYRFCIRTCSEKVNFPGGLSLRLKNPVNFSLSINFPPNSKCSLLSLISPKNLSEVLFTL